MLPEVILNLGEREAVFVLVNSTDYGFREVPHMFESVIFHEPGVTTAALVFLFCSTLVLPEALLFEF